MRLRRDGSVLEPAMDIHGIDRLPQAAECVRRIIRRAKPGIAKAVWIGGDSLPTAERALRRIGATPSPHSLQSGTCRQAFARLGRAAAQGLRHLSLRAGPSSACMASSGSIGVNLPVREALTLLCEGEIAQGSPLHRDGAEARTFQASSGRPPVTGLRRLRLLPVTRGTSLQPTS